jgi:MoaA/NifB/PqqE/SkfB family radical SAM enzyme
VAKTEYPKVIALQLTSRCNRNCKHCFAPKGTAEMSFEELIRAFMLFFSWGTKGVLLTGGEPLLRKDFGDIVESLQKHSFEIYLDTNGDRFFDYADVILESVDNLGLPIDFPNTSYRGGRNFNNVIKVLDYLKNNEQRPRIRVGTVATQDTLEFLEDIAELLLNYVVDIWKIYQFTPQDVNATANRASLEVSDAEFKGFINRLRKKYGNRLNIVSSARNNRSRAYFMVHPDGDVVVPIDEGESCKKQLIGNIFDEDIVEKWQQVHSSSNYLKNIACTLC